MDTPDETDSIWCRLCGIPHPIIGVLVGKEVVGCPAIPRGKIRRFQGDRVYYANPAMRGKLRSVPVTPGIEPSY